MHQSQTISPGRRLTGAGFIALGIGLNIPFALLAVHFDYPAILRQPTATVLGKFAAHGTPLILMWYAYALAAFAFMPLAVMLREVLPARRGLRLQVATMLGVMAGLTQLAGLLRWVFVVPGLAAAYTDPTATESTRDAVTVAFAGWHQYAGVAIGEHVGQLTTVLWTVLIGAVMWSGAPFRRWQAVLGWLAAAGIGLGLADGFATVIPGVPAWLGHFTPVGYLLFSVWMVTLGLTLWARPAAPTKPGTSPESGGSSV